MTTVRPGPVSIEPNRAPGGIVFHVYDVETGRRVVEDAVTIDDDVEAHAVAAAAMTLAMTSDSVVLVVYDGDSGRRWSAREIAHALGEP